MNVEEYVPEREVESEIPFEMDSLGMRLYRVDLDVYWGEADNERSARFTTLRAYSPDQAVLFNQMDGAADGSMQPGMPGSAAGQGRMPASSRPGRPPQDGSARR